MYLGIDYGAKKAGTTAVCFKNKNQLELACSEKNKDADEFVRLQIELFHPNQIFIDAPLSLPLSYFSKGTDYHFRECDRLAKAMSPMFLGGLTARAISLQNEYNGITFIEAYPKLICNELELEKYYKKDLGKFYEALTSTLPYSLSNPPINWHEADAVLTWMVGFRYSKKEAKTLGDKEEGLIYY